MPELENAATDNASSQKDIDNQAVIKAYRRYGRMYNMVFGAVFEPGRREALKIMNCQPGEKILELGVGTGLALPYYPDNVHVTAIDISEDMLRQAREIVVKHNLQNVEIKQMDAQNLQFPDDSYDKIAVMYVASVVPDPRAMLKELRRVCRPGGEIFVLNHFASRKPIVRTGEKMLAPLANLVGFHSDFNMDQFLAETKMQLLKISRVNAFGYWKLLHLRNNPPPSSEQS